MWLDHHTDRLVKMNSWRGEVQITKRGRTRVYYNVRPTSLGRLTRLPGMVYHGRGRWFGKIEEPECQTQ